MPCQAALRRCLWLIGWFTLFTQNLFPWYLLWLLPLLTVFVEPGRLLGFKLDAPTAWLLFSGTIALAYVFFVRWRVVTWAQVLEYGPLFALLLLSAVLVWQSPRTYSWVVWWTVSCAAYSLARPM